MQVLKVRRLSLAHLNLTKCLLLKGIAVPAYFDASFEEKKRKIIPVFGAFSPLTARGLVSGCKHKHILAHSFQVTGDATLITKAGKSF